MSTLTVPHAQLAAGDQVTGYVAGSRTFTLPESREVAEGRRRAEDGAVALVHPAPNTYGVEWWLYPDQADAWIVERATAVEPAELAAIAERVAAGVTGYRAVEPAPVPLNVGELDEAAVDRLAYRLAAALPHMPHVRRVETRSGRSEWQTVHLNRPTADEAKVGDVVLVGKYGKYQAAIVTKVGPKRLKLAHATPHGARERAGGRWGTVFHPYEPRSACYVVTTGDQWAARAVR